MKEKELNALITLLDDPDAEVFSHVSGKLKSYGKKVIPTLESAWEGSLDPLFQERVEDVIHKIQFEDLLVDMQHWLQYDSGDLLKGAWLVTKYHYSELEFTELQDRIEKIRRTIWLELNNHLTPLESVNTFNHVFYSILEFSGKTSSRNLFVNKVLDNRCGNALMLGTIYLIVARQLDLPVYGVDWPSQFLMAYLKDDLDVENSTEDARRKIVFYINPLTRGTIFSRNDVQKIALKKMENPNMSALLPCSNRVIIMRILMEMKELFKEDGHVEKANEIEQLIELFEF